MSDAPANEDNVPRVYWLGGGPCSGKTTVADILAQQLAIDVHHVDAWDRLRDVQLTAGKQPTTVRLHELRRQLGRQKSFEHLFTLPLAELDKLMLGYCREKAELILREVGKLPADRPTILESTHLLPESLAGVVEPRRALYMIASESQLMANLEKRRSEGGERIDIVWSEEMLANQTASFLERSDYIRRTASTYGFRVLIVDGMTPQQVADDVRRHFGL